MSSSDNTPRYHVKLRGISADLTKLGPQLGELDLGELQAAELVNFLTRFTAIDPVRLVEAEPQIILAGHRGRFIARLAHGRLLLQTAGDAEVAYVELAAADVPNWMDHPEGTLEATVAAKTAEPADALAAPPSMVRRSVVVSVLAASLVILGLSVQRTFQSRPLYSAAEFAPIADGRELARLQQQVTGQFATSDGSSEMIVSADGTLTYVEIGSTATATERTADHYTILRMQSRGPVLKAETLGPISIRDGRTLVFNGEPYTRK